VKNKAADNTAVGNTVSEPTAFSDPELPKSGSEKREFTRQIGRSTGGYELAFSPVLLALIGYGIDRLFGTVPVFTISLGLLGFIGAVVKIYFTYRSDMEQHEASGPWVR
jgi:F0F1-type ATP synthase assembly protein I